MTVRVHYRGTELQAGEIEDFPEATNWKTTKIGEIRLYQGDQFVGLICEGTWLSVIAYEDEDANDDSA